MTSRAEQRTIKKTTPHINRQKSRQQREVTQCLRDKWIVTLGVCRSSQPESHHGRGHIQIRNSLCWASDSLFVTCYVSVASMETQRSANLHLIRHSHIFQHKGCRITSVGISYQHLIPSDRVLSKKIPVASDKSIGQQNLMWRRGCKLFGLLLAFVQLHCSLVLDVWGGSYRCCFYDVSWCNLVDKQNFPKQCSECKEWEIRWRWKVTCVWFGTWGLSVNMPTACPYSFTEMSCTQKHVHHTSTHTNTHTHSHRFHLK